MKLARVQAALDRVLDGELVDAVEDDDLDFKQDPATVAPPHGPGNPRALLVELLTEAIVCFANSDGGGTVVVGLADKGRGASAFLGTNADPDDLRARIFNRTVPNLPVAIDELVHAATRLLVIDVPEGLALYTDSKGRAHRRENRECKLLTETERLALGHRRRNPDLTARTSERTAADLDPAGLQRCRELLANLTDSRRELASASDRQLLRGLGVVDVRGALLVAGEVLLCRPRKASATYLYRPAPGMEPEAHRLEVPLVLAHRFLLQRIADHRRVELGRVQLSDGQELAIPDYPEVAADEAITNALAHRDWGTEQEVVVDHSPQVLRVWSPGGLPPGVAADRLLSTPSRPRNHALMNAVRVLGLAEATSRGVDRMYREMIRTGRLAPRIVADDFSVEVIFTSGAPNHAFAAYVSGLPLALRENVNVLLVLNVLCSRAALTTTHAGELLQIGQDEAIRVLEWMSSPPAPLLEPTGRSSQQRGSWRLLASVQAGLGTAIRYRTRSRGGDERIVAHVREYGWVTNKTVRNLFNLDVQQARALLSDLRDRLVLVKDPDGPDRGPGIRYLPGPSFPQGIGARRRPSV